MNSPSQYAPVALDEPARAPDPGRPLLSRRWVKWLVVVGWVVLLAGAGQFASKVSDVEDNSAVAYLPREAQATRVAELLPRFQQDDLLPAVVVYSREGGLTAADRAAVAVDKPALTEFSAQGTIDGPIASADGKALMYVVPVSNNDDPLGAVERMRKRLMSSAPDGLETHVTGVAGSLYDQVSVFSDINSTLVIATVSVVAVLLLLTYRSPVLWLLPLLVVGAASQLASALIYLLGRHAGLPANAQSVGILTVLVFGAGTDYALLLIARYREELRRHADRHLAMAVALRRAAPAILASAGTVVLGLLCLFAADLNSTRSLGGVGAIGVACAAILVLTLLPALLVCCGRWVFWPRIPRAGLLQAPANPRPVSWATLAMAVGRRPRLLWASSVLFLAALLLGLTGLHLGVSDAEQYRTVPDSVHGQQAVARHYPAGEAEPAQVVAPAAAREAVLETIGATTGVARTDPAVGSQDGSRVLIPVVLADPPDTAAAERTIQRLRTRLASTDAVVGGPTAAKLDTKRTAWRDQWVVIPLALSAIALVLLLVLRSIVAPLMLIATVVLSYLAALGGTTILLDLVFGIDSVDYSLPLEGFLFLVALGVDYNVFLMTRVREEVVANGHRAGVLTGLRTTGGVITSAGIVLAGTFSVFLGMPLTSLAALGTLVALGVLLDTFLVRTMLVPALALDLGPIIWWPSWLGRRWPA